MKKITGILALVGMLVGSSQAFAATYMYIDANGEAKIETAQTASLAIDSALNRAPHSGVMVVNEVAAAVVVAENNDRDTEVYAYVDENGEVAIHSAETPREAINTAPDIKDNSGVMVIVD